MASSRKEVPTEYNEFIELINSNDASVVAHTIEENYTPNYKLEEIISEFQQEDNMEANEIISSLSVLLEN